MARPSKVKAKVITAKMLSVVHESELRNLCMKAMGLPVANAFSLSNKERVSWFVQHIDQFSVADLSKLDWTLYRQATKDFLLQLQLFALGEGDAPTYNGLMDDDPVPQVTYEDAPVWERDEDELEEEEEAEETLEETNPQPIGKEDTEMALSFKRASLGSKKEETPAESPAEVAVEKPAEKPAAKPVAKVETKAEPKAETGVNLAELDEKVDLLVNSLRELVTVVVDIKGKVEARGVQLDDLKTQLDTIEDGLVGIGNASLFIINSAFVEGDDTVKSLNDIPDQAE